MIHGIPTTLAPLKANYCLSWHAYVLLPSNRLFRGAQLQSHGHGPHVVLKTLTLM